MSATSKSGPEGRRRVSVLGATGSIGAATIDVLEAAGGRDRFDVVALTANASAAPLARAAVSLGADVAVVADERAYPELREALAGSGVEAAAGEAALIEAAGRRCDWSMAAIVGVAGLAPTLAAARTGATIALANKEALVSAAPAFFNALHEGGGAVLPVDSEHNAIFQCFDAKQSDAVDRIWLTASGGPFRTWTLEQMASAGPEHALKHPNWSMGAKISIDSATMFNKGLEIIEAARLFEGAERKIEVVVHPQSIIHSMVSYCDGSVLAQLGAPDMRTPIAYALAWPMREPTPAAPLDPFEVGRLDFERPDEARFPALRLAREALAAGGAAPTALNAANEAAVASFLAGTSSFLSIAEAVEATLDDLGDAPSVDAGGPTTLEAALEVDAWARRVAADAVLARSRGSGVIVSGP